MAAPRVLFVKLSSLGDVIHHLPAVSELAANVPGVRIHWAVEEAYAGLAAMHPCVERVIAVGLRGLRAAPWSGSGWSRMLSARHALRLEPYDYVIDSQGLAKSAAVAALAAGPRFGFDRRSARESFAARLYDVGIGVPRNLHAVERNRLLVARVFGYPVSGDAAYGIAAPAPPPAWAPSGRYFVALHAASRAAKRWAPEAWEALAKRFAGHGLVAVFPGGSEAERREAERLAARVPGAVAAPPMSLTEAASLLAGAECVVGVDTGLTHLAVALGRPTAGLYCATDPALTGLHGGPAARSLGAPGRPPTVDAVEAALGFGPVAVPQAPPPDSGEVPQATLSEEPLPAP